MRKLYFLPFFIFLAACVLPYDKAFKADRTILIIDALLTDDPSLNKVTLIRSQSSPGGGVHNFSETNAKIVLVTGAGERVNLIEKETGVYHFPENFEAETGTSYSLNMTTSDGSYFESEAQNLQTSSPIENITQVYKTETEADFNGARDGHSIYLNSSDKPDEENFYQWKWRLYEKIFYCKTCSESRYYRDSSTPPEGECREIGGARNVIYDYGCDGDCWKIFPSQNTNIMNDDFTDGRPIQNRHVADIPVYQYRGALLEVFQFSINQSTFKYLELVQSVAENTGGLADTPPASLQGNVRCISDPDQPVAGMFIVAGVSIKTHWLDRSDVPTNSPAIGFLDGRVPNGEPVTPTRPPLAPCPDHQDYTSIMPVDWQN